MKSFCLYLLGFIILSFWLAAIANAGHCHVRTYHHSHHVQAYAVPVNIFYSVGEQARIDARVEKAIQEREKEWKSLATGQPVASSLPDGSPDLLIKKFCAGCHGANKQAAGKRFDGTEAVDPLDFRAFYRMASKGEGIKPEMKAVMGKMTPEQKQQVLDELSAMEIPATSIDSEEEPGVLK